MSERAVTEHRGRRPNAWVLLGVSVALFALVVSGLAHPSLTSVALSQHGTAVRGPVSPGLPPPPSTHLTPALGGVGVAPTWLKVCANGGAQFLPICPVNLAVEPKKLHGAGLAWEPKIGGTGGFALLVDGSTGFASGTTNTSFKWTPYGSVRWASVANGPSAFSTRTNQSFVWDSADSEFLLFGGWHNATVAKNDTWKWTDAGGWAQVTGQTGLAKLIPRYSACMVNVPTYAGSKGGFVLLFGGRGQAGTRFADTWTFHAGTWTNITATAGTPPSARGNSACAWDDADREAVLFGGYDTALLNDTWTFIPSSTSGGSWFHPSTPVAPNPRQFSALSYVNGSSELALFSGARGTPGAPTNMTSDTWTFKAGTWANVTSTQSTFDEQGANNPTAVWGASFADLTGPGDTLGQGYAMKFGGQGTVAINSTAYFGAIPTANLQINRGEVVASKIPAILYFNTTGGFGYYKYAWTGLPTGCATANTSTLTCQPTVTGVLSGINVSVTDQSNVSEFGSYTLSVVSDPSLFYNFTTVKQAAPFANETATTTANYWASRLATSKPANSSLAAQINATPFVYWRYGAAADTVNVTNFTQSALGTAYSDAGVPSASTLNLSGMAKLMGWVHGQVIFILPGETNDSGQAVQEVQYVENTLHFKPAYWSVGNEPSAWIHYNIRPYAAWRTTDASTPTKAQYTAEVARFITAVRAFDPTARFIGGEFPGGITPASSFAPWALSGAQTSGTNVVAFAFHSYPDGFAAQPFTTLNTFLNQVNIEATAIGVRQYQANITTGCASCGITTRVDEFNAGLNSGLNPWGAYMGAYAEVPFFAETIAQTLLLNASSLAAFDFYGKSTLSMVNLTTGATSPLYKFYAGLAAHFALGTIFNVTVGNATGAGSSLRSGIWSVESVPINKQANGPQLLVVNGNTTVSFRANVSWFKSLVLANQTVTVYTDNSTSGVVSAVFGPGIAMPTTFVLPPMGVLVVNVSGQPGPAGGFAIPQSTLLLWLTLAGLALSVVTIAVVLLTRKGR